MRELGLSLELTEIHFRDLCKWNEMHPPSAPLRLLGCSETVLEVYALFNFDSDVHMVI